MGAMGLGALAHGSHGSHGTQRAFLKPCPGPWHPFQRPKGGAHGTPLLGGEYGRESEFIVNLLVLLVNLLVII